jgi:hypothetical protein
MNYTKGNKTTEYEVIDAMPSFAEYRRYFVKRFKEIMRSLFSIEPIITNLIALTICGVILFMLSYKDLIPNLGKYYLYLYRAVQFLACIQVIRSARKSLVIPLLVLLIAGIGLGTHFMPDLLPLSLSTFKEMMLVGLIGLAVTVFYIR